MPITVGIDTYIAVEDAEAYVAVFGPAEASFDEADMKRATLALDRLYGARFLGARTDSEQPLQWPRNGSQAIPVCVQHATAELAHLMQGGADPYLQPDPRVSEESIEVAGIKETRKYADGGHAASAMHKISLILAPVLRQGVGIAWADVVRA